MTTALLVIYGPSDGTEILRVAGALRGGRIAPTVYFAANVQQMAERLDFSTLDGVPCFNAQGPIQFSMATLDTPDEAKIVYDRAEAIPKKVGAIQQGGLKSRVLDVARKLPEPVKNVLRAAYAMAGRIRRSRLNVGRYNVLGEYMHLKTEMKECAKILDTASPDVLILPLESLGHHSATLACVADRRGIPVVIVPYSVPVNVAEIAERWYPDHQYWADAWPASLVIKHYPNWSRVYNGRALLRLRWFEIVARIWLGMAPERPWDGGGLKYAKVIAIENAAMLEFYRQERFAEGMLHITGTMVDDLLWQGLQERDRRRRELCAKFDLDPHKPILLSSMVPDFVAREQCQYDTYEELVSFWMQAIGRMDRFNVIVRLHPSLSYNDFEGCEKWGVKLVQEDTAHLMPICDLFVASISATIRWAIACGIPVVNYDVYKFRYEDYSSAQGVVTMEGENEFIGLLNHLNADEGALKEMRDAQRTCADQWGTLDGKAGQRMEELILSLV